MMQRIKYKIIIATLLFIILTACEHDTSFKLPPHTPKLVLHGYVQTGDHFSVAVGRTFAADVLPKPDDTYVTGAVVSLYENGVLKETLTYDGIQKRYVSLATAAIAGNQYRITVSAPGFETVEATTASPAPVNTVSVNYMRNTRTGENGTPFSDIIFRFDDPPGVNNFYLTEINKVYPFINSFTYCIYTYDPAVEKHQSTTSPFEVNSCIGNKEVLYSDQSFNGTRKEITLSAAEDDLREYTYPATGNIYWSYLKRYSVTDEYYRYIKTGIAINDISNNPFTQPVSTYTNVKNGYGLFTVYSAVTDTLR